MAEMERGVYVRMLSAVYIAMFLTRVAFGIVVVTFARYLTSSDVVYSLVVSVAPLLELLTIVFAAVLIDRYGRRGVLLTGLGLGAVSLYGMALSENPIVLGAVNAIHGVAAALILVTTLAVIATYAPAAHRGREMGLFNLANIFGWVAGFIIGSLLLDPFEGRLEYTFVIGGALATGGLLYANRMLKLPEESKDAWRPPPPTVGELLHAVGRREIVLLTAPWLIVFMLVGGFIAFFPRVAGGLDISGGRTAIGVLAVGALLMASQYFWGRLADRRGREVIMLVGAIGFAFLMGTIMFAYFVTPAEVVTQAVESFQVGVPAAVGGFTIQAAQRVEVRVDEGTPTVERVEPRSGPPGTAVVIEGRAFRDVQQVLFNGHATTFNVSADGRRIDTVVPHDATTGPLQLVSPTPPQVIFASVMSHWIILTIALFTALAFAPAGLAAIADEAKEGAQGTTMSAYSLTLSLGFIIGPPVLGIISQRYGGAGMVIFFAALSACLLALVLIRFVRVTVDKSREHSPRAR